MCVCAFYCSECPLDIDIVVPDSKVVRSGGRKRLFTSPVEDLALEHGAALHRWTEFKSYALRNKEWCVHLVQILSCNKHSFSFFAKNEPQRSVHFCTMCLEWHLCYSAASHVC